MEAKRLKNEEWSTVDHSNKESIKKAIEYLNIAHDILYNNAVNEDIEFDMLEIRKVVSNLEQEI